MVRRKNRIWGLFYLGDEIDRFDGAIGEGLPMSKAEAIKAFMLDFALEVKEIKDVKNPHKILLCGYYSINDLKQLIKDEQ